MDSPIHRSPPNTVQLQDHDFYTSRSSSSVPYTSRSLLPTHPPSPPIQMRPHCHQGYISGNDLPRQGQRQPCQCLRQWKQHNQVEDIVMYFFWRVQFILFSKFISFLVKIATMHRCGLREIGVYKVPIHLLPRRNESEKISR